ncbi:MAG: 4-hydroxy-tetrahydrodipicolinate synthase [Spirochaetia bacterium]|nr:4-hydroxy-tetrahydrodipicolinate synthase [Spirochaetia bacterium]MCF7945308.1 4-hydroxy-tetrahydrodipicolinate synthase [Spirochaetia bacterium]MCF7946591.1 4-hydroxy-tetrahydrodipicolinate synthase [Spirochaetia bacterium]
MEFKPRGIIPAMVTPLTKDYKVNEKALRKLIDFLIEGGVHGLFVVGTSGEFYGLSYEEKKEIMEISLDQAKGRVPIYAGTNGITTKETIKITQIAQECKVDAVSILTPMFISPSQQELQEHYKNIAKETDIPILLYNNVPKTGVTLTSDTVARLADIENIVGVKDSSGDLTLTSEYIRKTKNKNFCVLAGRDTLIHAALCYGGTGSIAACANIAPRVVSDIYDKYVSGDIKGSLEAQFKVAPIRMAFSLGSFPTVLKESLELLGIEAGPSYGPIGTMSDEEKVQLKKVLKETGVL